MAGAIGKPPPRLRRGEIPRVRRRGPTPHGRGGSVSRRDHNHAYRRPPALAWAHKSEGSVKPIPSYSSGEGVWGRGASLREAASPPESPQTSL